MEKNVEGGARKEGGGGDERGGGGDKQRKTVVVAALIVRKERNTLLGCAPCVRLVLAPFVLVPPCAPHFTLGSSDKAGQCLKQFSLFGDQGRIFTHTSWMGVHRRVRLLFTRVTCVSKVQK